MSLSQCYEVACRVCHERRWPTLPEKPEAYTCYRCRTGAGASRREAGSRGGRPEKSSQGKPQEGAAG